MRRHASATCVDKHAVEFLRHNRQSSSARSFFFANPSQVSYSPQMNSATDQFYELTPDVIMESVENAGWEPTGEYLQLNSYENRVFSIRLEKEPFDLIAKFYRPGRWSQAALMDEHEFLGELDA